MPKLKPMPVPAAEPLLTVREVAAMLQVSGSWVRQHANGRRRPYIACVKLGAAVRFRRSTVLAFIHEQETLAQ